MTQTPKQAIEQIIGWAKQGRGATIDGDYSYVMNCELVDSMADDILGALARVGVICGHVMEGGDICTLRAHTAEANPHGRPIPPEGGPFDEETLALYREVLRAEEGTSS